MRYNKSETRIINNAIKMADEVKKYHERTQSWDIPEHLIVDGCKVGKWWMKSPPPCGDITPMEVVSNSRAEPQS